MGESEKMISKNLEKEINEQVQAEFYSSYLYLSMAAYFDDLNLAGFAHWMKIQAQEELYHGMKFFDYLLERGGRAELMEIEQPPKQWDSPLAVFENAYEHEQLVTGRINKLMDLAIEESDHASVSMLNWFVDEQVEEEASADEIVQKLKLMKDSPGAVYMLDKELGSRPEKFPMTLTEASGE